jgi:adenylylsulfate kinase
LSKDLDFSKKGRDENVRRVGVIGDLLSRNGVIVLAALVSPYRSGRDEIRQRCPDRFLEVFVNAPLSICEERDTKGLYKRARSGQLVGLTGIDDPYEPPLSPEVRCETDQESIRQSVNKVLSMIEVKLEKLAAGL